MLPLLEVISEKYPPPEVGMRVEGSRSDAIKISCPRHSFHSVSPLGFKLLEEVELAFSSTMQEIISVEVFSLDEPLLSMLDSRV